MGLPDTCPKALLRQDFVRRLYQRSSCLFCILFQWGEEFPFRLLSERDDWVPSQEVTGTPIQPLPFFF